MNHVEIEKKYFLFACIMAICFIAQFSSAFALSYTLTVESDQRTQHWNRYYEMGVATCHMNTVINTYWGRGISNALKIGHDEAGFKHFRGHGILHDDIGLVNLNTDGSLKLNWTRFDSVYNLATRAGLRPIVEISTTPKALASGTETVGDPYSVWYNGSAPNRTPPNKGGWDRWMALMDSIVNHCKFKWGEEEVRDNWYFEVWNEPEWWYMGIEYYNELYDYTVTGLKMSDSLIKVGGPACGGNKAITGDRQFQLLLDHCHSGKNAATGKTGAPIDFLTYHWYANNTVPIGITGAVLDAKNLSTMHKAVLDTLRLKYPWFIGQVFIDEVGPTSRTIKCRDQVSSASWLTKTVHLLNENGPDYPPPAMMAYWAVSDLYEEFQNKLDVLSYQEGNYGLFLRGNSSYKNSWDIPKPIFQAYRMLHRLGDFEINSAGGTTDDGVNLVSTIDSSNNSIQILIYNHHVSETQSCAPSDDITLTVNNIPWAPGKTMVKHYLVDTTHSNTHTKWVSMEKPSRPSNAQWDMLLSASRLECLDDSLTVTLNEKSWTKNFKAHYYSVHLIEMSNPDPVSVNNPASKNVFLSNKNIKLKIERRRITFDIAAKGQFKITIYTTAGRQIFQSTGYAAGVTAIEIPKIVNGAYILQYQGDAGCFIKHLALQ
ncbi:MAG TPA: hypothetical protein VHO70_10070 [Chitinispirillaceae bacterium]|nr:hypothetical protein [Chitinispirillaceae bacterium]